MGAACGNGACGDDNSSKQTTFVDSSCIGCGACVAICGEVFDLDDEGMAFVKPDSDDTNSGVEDAIGACPVGAIKKK